MLRRRLLRRSSPSSAKRSPGLQRWSFGLRLFLSLALMITLVFSAGYVFFRRHLELALIEAKASEQHATAESFARSAHRSGPRALDEIQDLVEALATRPGTLEAIVIDRNYRIVAAGHKPQIGLLDRNAAVEAALFDGREFAGHEARPSGGGWQFEFITPIDLPSGRYALEVTQDDTFFEAEIGELRREVALLALFALTLGTAVFWLSGGRALLRAHKSALARAVRDGLTDLGNHRAFQDELERAVALAHRAGDPLTLVSLDLDGFKLSNDRHGHHYGDEVLKRTAAVLREGRVGDRTFRVGGDEFAVLLPETDFEGAVRYTHRLARSLEDANVSASIGFSQLRPGQDEPEILRQEADAALYEAKRRRGGVPLGFDKIRDRVALTSPRKVRSVHQLVSEGDLSMVFQPIWNFEGEIPIGFEALARPAEKYGFSGPAEAFDLAIRTGHVHQLDRICVRKALACAPELDADALLFVNVTPQTLDIDAGNIEWLVRETADVGLPVERFVVEVTERQSVLTGGLIRSLVQLSKDGFKLALDDAGTGSSGLEMLRDIHFDFVKIDRSVVNAAVTESRARGIFLALASYARQTGALVIAEGIEDEETLSFVQNVTEGQLSPGVQGGQGFLLGMPSGHIAPVVVRASA